MEKIQLVENVIEESMMSYSAYVLLQRALPDVRDGMKPVYRRILYMMNEMNASKFTKSANISGQIMKIHPHGSTYGTLVGMAQKDRHITPFIEGKGNFGSYTSRNIAPAADRYTEARLSPFSIEMMKDFKKGVVEFIPNYDGTMMIPEVLPANFPTILLFSQSGIGVGFSSSTLGFNLIEVSEALTHYLNTGEHKLLIPDFPTKGYIFNQEEQFKRIQNEGKGTVRLRAKAEITGNEISITEIPYGEKRERIIDKIVELSRTPNFKEIAEVKDLSGFKGQKIVVRVKRAGDPKLLLEKLYARTPLEATVSANNTVIIDKLPTVAGTSRIIEVWLKWRRGVLIKEFEFDLKKDTDKLNRMTGLSSILNNLDEVIEVIKNADEDKLIQILNETFNLNDEQSEFIANMRLRNINKAYIARFVEDMEKTKERIKYSEMAISSKEEQNKVMIEQFQSMATKYGKERQTEIMKTPEPVVLQRVVSELSVDLTKKVEVQFTKEGYIFVTEGTTKPTLKPGDEVIYTSNTTLEDRLLVYGEDCIIYAFKLQDLKDTKEKPRGTFVGEVFREDSIVPITGILVSEIEMMVNVYEDRFAVIDKRVFQSTHSKIKLAWNAKFKLVDIIPVSDKDVLKLELEDGSVKEIEILQSMAKGSRISQGVLSPNRKKIIRATK